MRIEYRRVRPLRVICVMFALGISLFLAGAAPWFHSAIGAPKEGVADAAGTTDDLQRSLRLDNYTVVADSGPGRGEVIYFYKCWMCHNKYTKGGPYLQELYQRAKLVSGEAVTDDSVSAKIKAGGPSMPAYRHILTDSDIADLRAYFRSGKCCVEGENPPANPWYRAQTNKWPVQSGLNGGAMGVVRTKTGDSPEGVGIQLVAPNGVRTTVYTDGDGKFEFPKMQAGSYTLRIATPVPFKAYRRDSVLIDGATKLGEIVLERIAESDNLPASPELESQLSGAELLWNIPGSAEEKATLQKNCSGCHSWQQVFRNRFDEHGWALVVDRMMHFTGTAIAVRNRAMSDPDPEYTLLVKWLTRVRGPESKDAPLRVFPRPRGSSTRVVVTEFEMPQQLLALHDAALDAEGNVWFTSHKTRYVGKMDPKTGIFTEYTLPLTPGVMPGTHHQEIDKNGIAWISENWAHQLNRLDPKTGEVKQVRIESSVPLNAPSFGNFTLDADGSLIELNAKAGRIEEFWPPIAPHPYTDFYEAMPDKNGEVWAGVLHGRQMLRFNPKTGLWAVYQMPEPYAYDRRTIIDASAKPVTVWYVDYNNYLVRVQPLD